MPVIGRTRQLTNFMDIIVTELCLRARTYMQFLGSRVGILRLQIRQRPHKSQHILESPIIRAGKNLGLKRSFLGFQVLVYAQSHAVHWTQDYDQDKGARRQVQGGALAPPWILIFRFLQNTIHAQCLTQRHHQSLFYRVKYYSRCWCSTSKH